MRAGTRRVEVDRAPRQILSRLLDDLSWASSRLEGNTYTRLDTQNLIELGRLAPGKDQREAQMIMHKNWDDAREEGREEGRVATLRRQIALKFGEITPGVEQRLTAAPPDEIDRLLERILFADSIDALFT